MNMNNMTHRITAFVGLCVLVTCSIPLAQILLHWQLLEPHGCSCLAATFAVCSVPTLTDLNTVTCPQAGQIYPCLLKAARIQALKLSPSLPFFLHLF